MPTSDPGARTCLGRLVKLWTCLLILAILVALAGGTTTRIHTQSAAAQGRRTDRGHDQLHPRPARQALPVGREPNSFDCSGLTLRAYRGGDLPVATPPLAPGPAHRPQAGSAPTGTRST
jgi:hypothetical protein